MKDHEARQSAHYDEIGDSYEAHYSDESSMLYRRKFLFEPLFAGIDLRGKKALDAMCGSGQTAAYLQSLGAVTYGLDVSGRVIEQFRTKLPSATGIQGSILDSGLPAESFDAVVVTGGLHHVQPNVAEAVDEIHRILQPGGWFCFIEPHAGAIADAARRLWYRFDPLFEENEQAVDLEALMLRNRDRFQFVMRRYSGALAYMLVYNSMVFRIPLSWKPHYTPPLLWLERRLEAVQGRRTSCFVLVQWRKSV